jgi:hypothetical protein
MVPTSQKTHLISITKPNRLMLFREIFAVYCENHTKHINILWSKCMVFFNINPGGTCSYHCALQG